MRVHIKQCIPANENFIIRTLQRDILDAVKNELVQLGDVNQRQKVCLTPIDSNNKLLKKRPTTWDEIKNGRFMIINGQHSIMASKELQSIWCAEQRRMDLRTWKAYIVWSLDAAQLRTISKFYNSTNHLNHTQPTWGGQMIGCREIWISCKRATNLKTDPTTRLNGSTFNLVQYNVRLNSKHVS